MEVRIEKLQPRRIAMVRHVGPYDQIGGAFERLCAWAGKSGVFGPDTQTVGLFHDNPEETAPEKLRSDAAVTVGEDVQGEGEVTIGEWAGGTYAVVRHTGCYSKMIDTYRWLYGEWMPANGKEYLEAPCVEVYLNDPKQVAPEELETDIYAPLKD